MSTRNDDDPPATKRAAAGPVDAVVDASATAPHATDDPGPHKEVPMSSAAVPILKLVNDQLAEERSSKSSLETRAVGVITTSGTLTTLLFALAALVTKSQTYTPPGAVRIFLVLAVIGFLTAAIVALLAARPMTYQEFTVQGLRDVVTTNAMAASEGEANVVIGSRTIDLIEKARQRNGEKATALKWAIYAEVCGTLLLGVAVAIALIDG